MKTRTLALAALLLLSAFAAAADHSPAVLTSDGVVYTVAPLPASKLQLVRREGELRQTVLVPSDGGTVTEAELAYDSATATLFVVWHTQDAVYVTRRVADGPWSEPLLIDVGAKRAGLELVITRVNKTTLLHAAWWKLGTAPAAEYALLAYEYGEHASTFVGNLDALSGNTASENESSGENELMSEVLHPPLAMARAGSAGVDIVYGEVTSTRLHRIILEPKIRPDVRIWKPSRKGGGLTPRAGLMSVSGDPVRVILNKGRIILYAPDKKFRFVIYENGRWSPERMIQLDDNLTREQLVEELRKAVERLDVEEMPQESVNE